ncbi:unnamed protein product [Lampetra planeri]
MAERVSGLSPSPRPPAILLSNSALSGSPGQSGDIGFHRILSQLKEFHNRRVEALLDKINKLKQERCLDALTLEEVFDSNRRLKEQLKRQKETIRELQHQWQSGVTIQEEPGGHGDNEGNINNDEGNDNAEGAGSKGSMWGRDGKQPGRTAALRLNKGSPVRKRVRYRHHSLERSHDCPMATLRQQHQRRQQKEELIFVPDTLALDVPDVKRRVSGVGTATKSPLPPARGTGPSPPWGPSTPDVCTTPSPSELGDDGPPARAPETRFIFTPRCGRKPPRACGHTGLLGPLHHGSLQAATPTSPDPASAETDADSPSLLGRKLSSQEPPAPPGPFTVASIEEAQNVGTTPPDAVPDVMRDFADWKITAAESVWWRRGQRWATSDERGEQGRRASGSRVVTGTSPPLEARGAASVLTSSGAAAATPAADTDGAEMMLWRIDPSACLSQYDEDSPTAQVDAARGLPGNDDNHGPEDLSVDCTFVNESVLLRHGGAIGRETTYICNDSLDDLFDRTCDGEEYVSFCLNDQSTVAHPRITTAAAHSTKRPISTAAHSPDRLDTTCSKAPTQKGCGQEPGFAYVDVVRNKDERRKLQGFSCKQCENFYSHLPEAERVLQMTECSRHRGRFQPPNTPENFWEVGFPSTQMCQERGYLKEEDEPANRVRRKRPYKATFSPARKQESHAWHTIARCTVHDTR